MYRFDENSTVCFFGDSITANGTWIRRIYDHYRKVEKIPCKMYNCGVPGDGATKARFRMEDTVFIHDPTDVVIMFGMNDVGVDLYDGRAVDSTTALERRRRIDSAVDSIREIADKCVKRGIRVIFCTPTLCDELAINGTRLIRGASAALREIGDRLRAISSAYGGNVVDFSAGFDDMIHKLYKTDHVMIREDRVHPLSEGHEYMAQLFLKAQGFDVTVSDTYDELVKLAQLPYDEWEEKRYELEQVAIADGYVRWDLCFGKADDKVIADYLANLRSTTDNQYVIKRIDGYAQDRENAIKARSELKAYMKNVKI